MSAQRHAILRQTLALSVAAEAQAGPLHEAARRAQPHIARLLERCCDELGAPDRLHRIDRLEVDLGALDPGRFEEALLDKLAPALRASLTTAIADLEAGGPAPRHASQWELLSGYLRTGRLPWWADVAAPGQPQASLALLLREAPDLVRDGMAPLLADAHAPRRLAADFDDALLAQLAAALAPSLGPYPGVLARALVVLDVDASATIAPATWRRRVWQAVLGTAPSADAAGATRHAYSQGVLVRVAAGWPGGMSGLTRRLRERAATADAPERAAWREVVEALAQGEPPAPAGAGPVAARPGELVAADSGVHHVPDADARTDANSGARSGARSVPDRPNRHAPAGRAAGTAGAHGAPHTRGDARAWERGAPAADDADVIPVANAGLVILWPFLSTFLARLDLIDEKSFRDEAARQRGAVLLHCLATGEAEAPEYLLPLNKVLCGLPLDAPVELAAPLRPDEIEECGNLLAAAIAHAPVLNAMSVDGFRASFLLRAGTLGVRDGAWLLRVERETHDLVLDRFPWSVDWVALPWMADRMQVEW